MGRRERPLAARSDPLTELAAWLRELRSRSGLTYRQMSAVTGVSPTTLSRAAAGRFIPQPRVVHLYALACGGSEDRADMLWKRAYAARHDLNRGYFWPTPPHLVTTPGELRAAMAFLYHLSGLTYRELERRAVEWAAKRGSRCWLPRSTIHNMLSGRSAPRREKLLVFAAACGVSEDKIPEWGLAWDRVFARRSQPPFRAGYENELLTLTLWGIDVGSGRLAARSTQLHSRS